ncbi:phospholipid/cholesterol/gamma-HCH transport system ATP-binding protein [Candidatus Xenohaliotis californiensis]|uniref:Phospholipid/cholesterol/gamma-HCH transport system ATP-binding protein n=1 Tax=Candidatus Xenohaliotis californiensis TaxID=84677 RepID=A0ABM9N7Z5_9RICK|nr:phospholipid/cholesterol/gamma-HCH transport system ATP-binding protein [Candidatus Xenohaliotis californiensis]
MIPQISINNIYKSFSIKHKYVINNISLDINKGESLAVLGCSGSGKSVLIKLMIGLLKPDTGSILVNGKEITNNLKESEFNNIMSKMSVLFQGGALFDSLNVKQNICFGLNNYQRLTKSKMQQITQQHLQMVGLEDETMDLYPSELSGGMQKRVALARALAKKPEIIFLDEPTTGLDPILTETIDKLIINHCTNKMTTITITHNIKSACRIANKIAVLNKGGISWYGPTMEIHNAKDELTKKLLYSGNI